MPKGYWVNTYRAITNPDAFQAYAKLSGPAIEAVGGKFLVRGNPSRVYENGMEQHVVIIEFQSRGRPEGARHRGVPGCAESAQQRSGSRHPNRRGSRLKFCFSLSIFKRSECSKRFAAAHAGGGRESFTTDRRKAGSDSNTSARWVNWRKSVNSTVACRTVSVACSASTGAGSSRSYAHRRAPSS